MTEERLVISVFNDAQVAGTVLERGESRARQILAQAGIQVTWLNCGAQQQGTAASSEMEQRATNPCLAMAFPEHLSVRILTRPLAATEDTFGNSFLDEAGHGCYADVYHGSFELMGSDSSLRAGEILGHVIAHEVGHLLLGPNSHSASGLMRARWESGELMQAARGNLLFTPAQAALMRERLDAFRARSGKEQASAATQSGK